ncbi:MAG: energy-coupling factor ABC transporter ATP-binding protein [Candidatus Anammoxibacter sp.]
MIALQVNNIKHRYHDGTLALRGALLNVKEGEILAILGPNGSGKTTLLKHLNGLLKPSGGEVLLMGKSLRKYSSKEIFLKIGMVFQDPNDQLFAPTVWDDVAYGPTNLGLGKDEIHRRVDEALQLTGMSHCTQKSVNALSFGQKKRICVAGVLAMKPEILLLDEPTCGLDPAGVHSIMLLLKELNNMHGITIIMSTNCVDLVPVYMDRLAIMYQGLILKTGSPEDVFTDEQIIKQASLELPQIAQLMQILREKDCVSMKSLPLTVREAGDFLAHRLNSNREFVAPN